MAGLFIKELVARGDLQRCLVVCPGNLTEQWPDELYLRFQLPFEILTNDKLESALSGQITAKTVVTMQMPRTMPINRSRMGSILSGGPYP